MTRRIVKEGDMRYVVDDTERIADALVDIAREFADLNSLLAVQFGQEEEEDEDDPGERVPGHPVGIYAGDAVYGLGDLIQDDIDLVSPLVEAGWKAGTVQDFLELLDDEEMVRVERRVAARRKPSGRRTSGGVQPANVGEYGILAIGKKGTLAPFVAHLRYYSQTHTVRETHAHARDELKLDVGYWAIRDLLQERTYR